MAGTKEIKRRIKSVKNTKKITKAMELVSASKMKRAVSQTLSSRLYAGYSWEILTSLSNRLENITHPFFKEESNSDQKSDKDLIVLISSNRGLCGGYNSQIIKKTINSIKEANSIERKVEIISIGKKGDNAMRKTGQNIIASFIEIPDINIKIMDIIPVSTMITEEFKRGTYENVYISYTDYVSALSQKPKVKKILPISKEEIEELIKEGTEGEQQKDIKKKNETPYLFEGDTDKLLEMIVEKIVRMQIYQMILESNASEQSSRMMAMKNANEAAEEMINDLTLMFNKARQAGITREISEISAGMASIN